jgi:hypothetical protein
MIERWLRMPSPYLFSIHGFDVEFESLQVYDEGGGELSECASAQCLYFTPWRDPKNDDYNKNEDRYDKGGGDGIREMNRKNKRIRNRK